MAVGSAEVGNRQPSSMRGASVVAVLAVAVCALGLRWLIALGPHSGKGKAPMFGDFEAQRHWMEVTLHLPVAEWYVNTTRNNLLYWGLDYPPLTAFHSMACGWLADRIDPQWVALGDSRGIETTGVTFFMRAMALLADLAIFFPAAYLWAFACPFPCQDKAKHGGGKSERTEGAVKAVNQNDKLSAGKQSQAQGSPASSASLPQISTFLLVLIQPCMILIDHGHFQFNSISLGLTLAAVAFLRAGRTVAGSIFFTLALNYKQMSLYHALPFFFYLLGHSLKDGLFKGVMRVIPIGLAVLVTTAVIWVPFLYPTLTAGDVLRRLFPVARGLFEDKVSNIWCCLDIVLKLRRSFDITTLFRIALVATLGACVVPGVSLLRTPTHTRFVYALVTCALAFFLLSFQVHEKSILLAVLPVSLLYGKEPLAAVWMTLVAAFSMTPLFVKDGLVITNLACMLLFFVVASATLDLPGRYSKTLAWKMFIASLGGMVAIHAILSFVPPPPALPDLFTVLLCAYCCAHFVGFYAYFLYRQLTMQSCHSTIKTKSE